MTNKLNLSPLLMNRINTTSPAKTGNQQAQTNSISPLLAKRLGIEANSYDPRIKDAVLAQNQQIIKVQGVQEAGQNQEPYKNNLKEMLTHNRAQILAVIPRIMNAQDTDGNQLIQEGEVSGNLVNAIERLDEIKDDGFNTLHMLPIHPPGKTKAMGTAGSLYAPLAFVWEDGTLAVDPEIVDTNPQGKARERIQEIYKELSNREIQEWDKNDQTLGQAEIKYFNEECHKRGISVMLDLPSCASVDFAKAHPELMAVDANGKEKVPQGWQDIRMFKTFTDEHKRILNKPLLDMHKQYVDACINLDFDGIRADVGRAKPVEFWYPLIEYSHARDPQFAWLAETYTHEDASPQLNMPYDRPKELLEVGFDSYYGQYHIFNDWTKAPQLYDYVRENIELNNEIGSKYGSKSLIGSFATHDDQSPMLYGGAPWVMFTSILQSMLPQVNPYITDGVQTGDYYKFPYENGVVKDTLTDNHECTVHSGRMDIFNKSRKPGGNEPEIENVIKTAFALRDNRYNEISKDTKLKMNNAQDVITKGSFIILPSNNDEVISFARHKDGKTLLFIGNRNVNKTVGATITIPGLKPDQKFDNLMPKYGEDCKFQNNGDGTISVELGTSRACVFEIDDNQIEKLSEGKNVLQQKYL